MKLRIVVTEGPDTGRVFVFERRDRFVVGRSPEASLSVSRDPYFSRHHFLLEIDPPNVLLRDLKSANGTFLNEATERVGDAPLRDGDVIRAGKTRIRLEHGASDPDEQAEPDAPENAPGPAFRKSDDARLPPTSNDTEEVRCTRCGSRAKREQPRARAERVAYFCDACRVSLLDQPVLLLGYRLVRELGRGSMGVVYLAVEEATGTQRALKIVLPHAAQSEKARQLFLQEASEQVKLSHPRIVQVLALREVKLGMVCMAMEYVDGPSAEQLLAREGGSGLEPRLAATIIAQALEGLGFAHQAAVVHRDVKEANILVARDASGEVDVKLSDFGLAKSFATSGASGFTHGGAMGGTVLYMAPEQILNFRDVRPAADIYSMGVAFYRLLSGEYPIDVSTRDPFLAVLEDPIVPLRRRKPALPQELAAVAERALGKRPQDRFATAEDMRSAILAALR